MFEQIRVVILDHDPRIMDGYLHWLRDRNPIEVVGTITSGEQLEALLARDRVDVLLFDVVDIPITTKDQHPYPILKMIPNFIKLYPYLNPVAISMFAEPGLVRAILETGVRGYLLKDDIAMIRDLAKVIVSVANGNLAFSDKVFTIITNNKMKEIKKLATPK